MKISELKTNVSVIEKAKNDIIHDWCTTPYVKECLEQFIDIKTFEAKYAVGVFDYYTDIIKGKVQIGDCPDIKAFLKLCTKKEVAPHELFLICSGFKKALIACCLKMGQLTESILNEIIYITDINLSGVLELYKHMIKQKNKKIQEQENWLKQYINVINSTMIVSATDTEGIITHANQNFCDVSGYSAKELLGQPHSIIRHPDSPTEQFRDLWNTIKNKQSWTGIIKNRKKDGDAYYVSTVIFPILNTDGEIVEYMSARIDITQLFTLQKEKQNAERLMMQHAKMAEMGEMIGMIAHQWQQPLNAINILLDMIEEDVFEEEQDKDTINTNIHKIQTQTGLMAQIINDFRSFYKPDKQQERFRACEVAEKVYNLIDVKMKKLGIVFNVHAHKHFYVLGYPNDFKQVILNIYKNACDKFEETNQNNPRLDLIFDITDHTGTIIIKDNAGGIPEELLPSKLFDIYVTTKGEKGTGLGLKLCKTIVELKMNGKIYARNRDDGAEFVIELPLANDTL